MHRLATPRLPPVRLSAWISVRMMREPVEPIGCPRAQAPPWMLSFSWEMPRSSIGIIATMAKASLISNRSTSSTLQPTFLSSFSVAPIGATVNSLGWRLLVAWPRIRASGCRPRCCATLSRASTSAEAPSEIELALAAVTVPSFLNAGLSPGILSILALPGCSSVSTTVSPLRVFTVTGTISSANQPLSMAAWARLRDSMAKLSICSRLMPRWSATSWAKAPIRRPVSASSRPSRNM